MELFAYGIEQLLRQRVGPGLRLTLTNNRRSLVSVRRRGDLTDVRLARLFLAADVAVTDALAAFIAGDVRTLPAVAHQFAENCRPLPHILRTARKKVTTKGASHDLAALARKIDRRYFAGSLKPTVTWGRDGRSTRKKGRKRGRSIQLGSYNPDRDLITLHPALDSLKVPAKYVGLILYHEMLHKKMGVERGKNGRRSIHSRDFRAAERNYEDYAIMMAWEKKHFDSLFFTPQGVLARLREVTMAR